MIRPPWPFLLLSSVSATDTFTEPHDMAFISESLQALKSIGVIGIEGLCHPSSDHFLPLITKCPESLFQGSPVSFACDECSHQIQTQHSYLRRERQLQAAVATENDIYSIGRNLSQEYDAEVDDNHDAGFYIVNIGGTVVTILLVALISGMFLGFLTLDVMDLRIKMQAAIDPAERTAAASLFPVVQQNHRLLVTLLLMNAIAYECLPLFLDQLLPTYLTIVFSVTVLLIFGEIIPSAIFTGPDQLLLASKLVPLVKVFMAVLHPISNPLVKLMARLNQHDSDENEEEYNRAELSALVRIQFEERINAQRQRDMANVLSEKARLSSPLGKNSNLRRSSHVRHMANQLHAEKKRRHHDDYHTNRSWRRLKEEIMTAADKHLTQHAGDNFPNGSTHRRSLSGGQSLLQRIPSLTSASMSHGVEPAHEQITPPLERTEVRVVEGALNLKTMCALDVYTPLRMIFAVPEDLHLTKETFAEIYGQGYSRVPVYEPQPPPNENRTSAMKGILMTRQLIMIDWQDERPVSSLPLYIPPCVSPRMNLVTLLHLLRKGGSLIAFVCAGPHIAERALNAGKAIPIEAGFMGIVTLQDVLESVLQERIYDEADIAQRHMASAVLTQWAVSMIQKFVKRRKAKRLSTDNLASKECVGTPTDTPKNEKTPLLQGY